MKYIRTENGIYSEETLLKKARYNDGFAWWQKENLEKNKGHWVFDGDIIVKAVADTIEELCDVFIYDFGKDKDLFKNDKLSIKILKANNNEKVKIYGAVWCEFGLKYVAKLNSKGELELL